MQAVNPANIAMMITTGNGNLEENRLYALLISRQEEIIILAASAGSVGEYIVIVWKKFQIK